MEINVISLYENACSMEEESNLIVWTWNYIVAVSYLPLERVYVPRSKTVTSLSTSIDFGL